MAATLEDCGNGRYRVAGELDFDAAVALRRAGEARFAGSGPLQIDLAGVTRSNSAGVALLVEWLRQARARNRPLRFIHVPAQMLAIIRVADLDGLLPLGATDEASDDAGGRHQAID
ncbi:MAG: STAS domain-containing protein [Pseudomonadota bacterium]|nr:STAS domain-containing protein [Pseudomonadota bacterium]